MVMTINKAIKNLKLGRKDAGTIPPEEYTATIDVAIEALIEVKQATSGPRKFEGVEVGDVED